MQNFDTDVVIIGAGPAGLFAIFEAGMLGLKAHVVDTLDMVGGQCSALYPEKPIYDIPAHPSIPAQEFIDKLAAQAAPFTPIYHLGEYVEKIEKQEDDSWQVTTSKATKINCKVVIIAAGGGAFGPNRPPLENLTQYEGKSVFYMVSKREDFRGKKVVIAGGGDSAVDWAISLSELTEKLYVIHRRAKFRCAPESAAKLQALTDSGKIEMITPYQLDSLEGDASTGKISAVIVATMEGEKRALSADILLPFFGLSMELGAIADWNLQLENNHISVNHSTMQTNIEGIFAIGDIATYEGKLKLILTGFAEAAIATRSAHSICKPNDVLHFGYSTSSGIPKL